MANSKSMEQQACDRLIDHIIRSAENNNLDTIRMEDIVFTMQYTVTHMTEYDASFGDRFISQFKIVKSLAKRQPAGFVGDVMKLTEVLCHLISEIDITQVKFFRNLLNIWHFCLTKIPEKSRHQCPATVKAQFAKCVRFMVNARSFSLQITMLDILHLYLGNSMTDFLRNSELPDSGLAFIKSYRWADSLTFKQELLSRINGSREHDEINLIMSKPLHSVKFGDTLVACSGHETWLHWNMWLGTFEFWIDQRMITINANQMKKTEMKRDNTGLIFTLESSPKIERKFGKKSRSSKFDVNVVEVVSESKFKCDWWHPLAHMFDDKFGYERIHLKRPASENVDAPLAKKMTQLPGCSQNMDEASKISGKLSLC